MLRPPKATMKKLSGNAAQQMWRLQIEIVTVSSPGMAVGKITEAPIISLIVC